MYNTILWATTVYICRIVAWARDGRVLDYYILYNMGVKSLTQKITFDFIRFCLLDVDLRDLHICSRCLLMAETRHSCSLAYRAIYVYYIIL